MNKTKNKFSLDLILIIALVLILLYLVRNLSEVIDNDFMFLLILLCVVGGPLLFYALDGLSLLGRLTRKDTTYKIKQRKQLESEHQELLLAERGHNGIALLFNEDKNIRQWFYANSQITLHKVSKLSFHNDKNKNISADIRISEADAKSIEYQMNVFMEGKNCVLCTEDTLNSPHVPLAIVTPDLEFQYISSNESDYERIKTTPYENYKKFEEHTKLRTRVHCSEKKILHKIFGEYSTDVLKDCTLFFFSEMAPCTSCLSMLRLEKEANTFKEIKCYYKDLLLLLDSKIFEGASEEDQNEINNMIKNLIKVNKNYQEKLMEKKDIDEN